MSQPLLELLLKAEDRLTRRAEDEQDIAVLIEIRNAIAHADPQGAGKRFIKG